MEYIDRVTRRLKLQNLRVLDAVVRSGSMARAAGELHISQPAISKAIGELEHTVGVRLLDRGRYGVEPTAYGRALLRRSVTVFDELRESVKEIEYLSDPTAGELRIGALEAVAAGLLAATIERLSRKHPRIHLPCDDSTLAQHALHTRSTRAKTRSRDRPAYIDSPRTSSKQRFCSTSSFMWLPVQRAPGPADGVSGWLNWSMSPGFSRRRLPLFLVCSRGGIPRQRVGGSARYRADVFASYTQWFARERPLPHNSPGQHASFRRQLFAAQGAADRIADQTTAGWDRHPEESDAESGGAALPRLRTRGRQAFGRRKISAARSVPLPQEVLLAGIPLGFRPSRRIPRDSRDSAPLHEQDRHHHPGAPTPPAARLPTMSLIGPTRTSRHVRFSAARGGEADNNRRMRAVAIESTRPSEA